MAATTATATDSAPQKEYTKDELYAIANILDAPGEGKWRRVLGSFLREAVPTADDVNLRKIIDAWRPTFEGLVP